MASELKEVWRDLNVPAKDNGCVRCRKLVNVELEFIEGFDLPERTTPVTWRCAGCNGLVCRDCTLTKPGWRRPTEPHGPSGWDNEPSAGGREYFHETLCSKTCWERRGKPED